jgi:hypothetical protein
MACDDATGIAVNNDIIRDLEYADDAALLAETLQAVMILTASVAEEGKKLGLKLNIAKTKIMSVTRQYGPQEKTELGAEEIEKVDKFVYLGSQISSSGGCEGEIKRRIALATSTFNRLWDKIFKRRNITMRVKLRLLNAAVIPVLTYGCESWSMTAAMEKRLNACESKWLRRLLRISYKDRVTNADVRERTGQEEVENFIRRARLRWMGHVMRMEEGRVTSKIYEWRPKGRRPAGRPKTRWTDTLEKDLGRAGLSLYGVTTGRVRANLQELAEDRAVWKEVTKASTAATAFRMIT